MTPYLFPPPLQAGDQVRLVASAKAVSAPVMDQAEEILLSWGLRVSRGAHLLNRSGMFAGTDAQRETDLQAAFQDATVKAIFFARGGYGTGRILDRLDFSPLLAQPKWLIGFSDVTCLHAAANGLGMVTLHGPMPEVFGRSTPACMELLRQVLFGLKPSYNLPTHPQQRQGHAQGKLLGGNLSLVVNSLATPTETDTQGTILFLEDVGEYLYQLDRLLLQLRRSGKLAHLAGLVLGAFTELQDNEPTFGESVWELVTRHVEDYDYPVICDFPAGHQADNRPLLLGSTAQMEVTSYGASLRFL